MPLNLSKLRKLVDQTGSTAEAARRIGMQPNNLTRLLSGDRVDVRLSMLERLAKALNCAPEELIR